jgi:hypothetical protein
MPFSLTIEIDDDGGSFRWVFIYFILTFQTQLGIGYQKEARYGYFVDLRVATVGLRVLSQPDRDLADFFHGRRLGSLF